MTLIQRSYTVRFLTPAFLGDAEQNGAWRTPPFKALLRQWWRVAYVRGREPTDSLISQMREQEGRLFGNSWLEANADDRAAGRSNGHCRSMVRIRLAMPSGHDSSDAWTTGTQYGVTPLSGGFDTSYSWFGLIKRKDRATKAPLPDRTGIKTNGTESERRLYLLFPEEYASTLGETLQLIHTFGQVGSRSRTGWGAIHLDSVNPFSTTELRSFSREQSACLAQDWALALGRDEQGPWVWESTLEFKDWAAALTKMAALRKEVRTSLKSPIDLRPLLGFADDGRMPSPLRWRVFRAPGSVALKVRVFALPHRIPAEGKKDGINRHVATAWSNVSKVLDNSWLRRAC